MFQGNGQGMLQFKHTPKGNNPSRGLRCRGRRLLISTRDTSREATHGPPRCCVFWKTLHPIQMGSTCCSTRRISAAEFQSLGGRQALVDTSRMCGFSSTVKVVFPDSEGEVLKDIQLGTRLAAVHVLVEGPTTLTFVFVHQVRFAFHDPNAAASGRRTPGHRDLKRAESEEHTTTI
jgi:hypothetical protein